MWKAEILTIGHEVYIMSADEEELRMKWAWRVGIWIIAQGRRKSRELNLTKVCSNHLTQEINIYYIDFFTKNAYNLLS